jgi:hypothetical protein
MPLSVEDLEDQTKFRLVLTIPYNNLLQFVFDYLKKRSALNILYWFACISFLISTCFVKYDMSGYYTTRQILVHSVLGFIILPLICIPFHEVLHIIPYYISGARNIRVGMDLKQFLFYISAHRYVAAPTQFIVVAIFPFIIISLALFFLVIWLPGIWKLSMSIFLFVHSTMCAGDFALLNFYYLNRNKKIYTWDDVDNKMAYFYEKL